MEKPRFWRSFVQITRNLGKYFILGMLIASVLTIFIPEEAIPQYIGSSGIFAYAVAVLVGIPLYVCEGEEIPITDRHTKAALKDVKATTLEWLTTARNHARYANEGGIYDEVLAFLNKYGKS